MKKTLLFFTLLTCYIGSQAQSKAELTFNGLNNDTYAFENILKGRDCSCRIAFINTGTEPLIITDTPSSCGCAVASHSKEPIAPGETGWITYKYDSNRMGVFTKTVTVHGNFEGGSKVIRFTGNIVEEYELPAVDVWPKDQLKGIPDTN